MSETSLDYKIFLIVDIIIALTSIYAAYESYRLKNENKNNISNSDVRSGFTQRLNFYYALFITSGYKSICMLFQLIYFINIQNTENIVYSILRFSPDLLFLTVISMLIFNWSQVISISLSI